MFLLVALALGRVSPGQYRRSYSANATAVRHKLFHEGIWISDDGTRVPYDKHVPPVSRRLSEAGELAAGTDVTVQMRIFKLEEVNGCLDRLEKLGDRSAGKSKTAFGRCCGLLVQGQDVLVVEEEFDTLDGEIKA